MRDIVVTAIVLCSLPYCFFRPWIGILVFAWLSYMNPHRLSFGFAYSMPFAEMVAVTTLGGLLLGMQKISLPRARETGLLLALWALFAVTTVFCALNPKGAWPQFEEISKILLMTFVTMLLIDDRPKLRALLMVIALSIGFFGVKGAIWGLATGGADRVLGPESSFLSDNNDLALALDMVLPLFVILWRTEERRWAKQAFAVCFALCCVGVLLTYSRGGFLGLATVLAMLLLRSRRKGLAVVVLAVSLPLMVAVIPSQWFDRMETIQDYEEDSSAQSRLLAWQVAWGLALDHPVLGAGFKPFTRNAYEHYTANDESTVHDAHSIYFQMLAEQGFVGMALFVALIASTLLSLRRLENDAARDPTRSWVRDYAVPLQMSVAAYLVGGTFLGRAYFDLFYHIVAAVIILSGIAALSSTPVVVRARSRRPAPRVVQRAQVAESSGT